MAIIIPKLPTIRLPKRTDDKVFRMFKRLDDGRLMLAGFALRYNRDKTKRTRKAA